MRTRMEGGGPWLAPSLPWEALAERRPKIFTENIGVSRTFSPSEWKSWGGVDRDFTTKHRGGNGLDGYFTTPSSAPPFSPQVFISFPRYACVYVCVCGWTYPEEVFLWFLPKLEDLRGYSREAPCELTKAEYPPRWHHSTHPSSCFQRSSFAD